MWLIELDHHCGNEGKLEGDYRVVQTLPRNTTTYIEGVSYIFGIVRGKSEAFSSHTISRVHKGPLSPVNILYSKGCQNETFRGLEH